jgi:exodeoxyribonuclease VIII
MKDGFYTSDELPIDIYHGDRGSISQSGLKKLDQSAAHLRAYLDGDNDKPQTKGMFIGSAIHAASLEPDVFDEQYIVAPAKFGARNAAGFKAWCEEQDPAKIILMAKESDGVYRMRDALHSHPWVGPRLRGATCEYSCFATDPETGVQCRVRFDMITSGGLILDLKKTQDARDGALAKSIANYGYYVQNAFYMDVPSWLGDEYAPDGFAFVFIEESAPHGIAVRFLDPDDIERGRAEYRRLLNKYAICLARDEWAGYSNEPAIISLPGWMRHQLDSIGE